MRPTVTRPAVLDVNKDSVKFLQSMLSAHAESMAQSLNWDALKCNGTRASYDPTSGEINVTIKFRVESADQERKNFNAGCDVFGIKEEAFNAPIVVRGRTFHLVGFDFGRRKFPVVTKDEAGKVMLWGATILDKLPASLRERRDVKV